MKGKLLVFITVGLALVFVSPPLVQQDRNQNLWRSLGNMVQSAAPAAAADVNLALGKPAQQSSIGWGGDPRRAVDGNPDGNYWANSVSHTEGQAQPWWQVDLGSVQGIRNIRICNRTDGYGDRLAKFYVFVSENPFPPGDVNSVLGQRGVWNYYHDAAAGRTTDITVNRNARYVRVQLSGTNYLQLAEVEVFGGAAYQGSSFGPPPVSTPMPGDTSLAQGIPPGVQVNVAAFGKDETDGSDVGWNSHYPAPSFDDDPNRRGLPNARWQGAHHWQGDRLCLVIQNLEAPYPPAHTLAVGYRVTLQGATFEDGLAAKTLVMYRYSGVPAKKNISECYRVINMASAPTGRDYTSAIPRTPSASFNPAGQGFASSPYVLPPPSQQTGRDYTGTIPRTLSASFNLTGRWRSNDGGAYFLRQVGNQLWWYGQSGDNGRTWTNVFQGRIEGSQVIGSWADVPHGQIMHNGEMSLQIVAPNFLRAVNRTGGFGGSEWSR